MIGSHTRGMGATSAGAEASAGIHLRTVNAATHMIFLALGDGSRLCAESRGLCLFRQQQDKKACRLHGRVRPQSDEQDSYYKYRGTTSPTED